MKTSYFRLRDRHIFMFTGTYDEFVEVSRWCEEMIPKVYINTGLRPESKECSIVVLDDDSAMQMRLVWS